MSASALTGSMIDRRASWIAILRGMGDREGSTPDRGLRAWAARAATMLFVACAGPPGSPTDAQAPPVDAAPDDARSSPDAVPVAPDACVAFVGAEPNPHGITWTDVTSQ